MNIVENESVRNAESVLASVWTQFHDAIMKMSGSGWYPTAMEWSDIGPGGQVCAVVSLRLSGLLDSLYVPQFVTCSCGNPTPFDAQEITKVYIDGGEIKKAIGNVTCENCDRSRVVNFDGCNWDCVIPQAVADYGQCGVCGDELDCYDNATALCSLCAEEMSFAEATHGEGAEHATK